MQKLSRLLACCFLVAFAPLGFAANLIVNGDFSAGNTGFQSDYIYAPSFPSQPVCNYPSGMNGNCYSIETSPQHAHNLFANFPDHTGGPGPRLMLVANGAPAVSSIWRQSVTTVAAYTRYAFSLWISPAYTGDPSPANLRIEVDTTAACGAGNTFTSIGTINAGNVAGAWAQIQRTLVTGSSTSICIQFVNQNTAVVGNDFALDDISLDAAAVDPAAPTANPDSATTLVNTPVTLDVLANDGAGTSPINPASIDLDPSTPGIQSTLPVTGGTFNIVGNRVVFTPTPGFVGTATATYLVSANNGSTSNIARITVVVALVLPVPSIPTLSEWATMILCGILAGLGIFMISRQRRA